MHYFIIDLSGRGSFRHYTISVSEAGVQTLEKLDSLHSHRMAPRDSSYTERIVILFLGA